MKARLFYYPNALHAWDVCFWGYVGFAPIGYGWVTVFSSSSREAACDVLREWLDGNLDEYGA